MFFAQQRSALVPLHSPQGCPQGANAHMGFLDIKHVQLDTMAGHFLLPALLAFPPTAPAPNQQVQQQQAQQGQGKGKGKGGSSSSSSGGVRAAKGGAPVALPTQGQELLVRMCTFFSDHCKDAGESLFAAYTSGVYSKVGPHCGFFPFFSPALSSVAVPCLTQRGLLQVGPTPFFELYLLFVLQGGPTLCNFVVAACCWGPAPGWARAAPGQAGAQLPPTQQGRHTAGLRECRGLSNWD